MGRDIRISDNSDSARPPAVPPEPGAALICLKAAVWIAKKIAG
jgi:hypothetical protein